MKSSVRNVRIMKTPRQRQDTTPTQKDPVQVFCRIRPLQSDADLSCVRVEGNTTVVLSPPEIAVNYKLGGCKETQYIFKKVFDAKSTQRDVFSVVAEPLVENLVRGRNGLLFTYGVTGSGKTYTMTGDNRDRGIMPRSLDSLFKTISDYQSKKYVFRPDRLNGFEIVSEADAMLERQKEMNSRLGKPTRKDSDPEIASQASTDIRPLEGLDDDNMYSVFITYVEVYNNSVYDLLEAGNIQRTLQSKIIRPDSNHNMYVHGVTEIEIKSVEEAIEAFQLGQKRKRMGHTILNAESSRSHAVFTIRLVQAPTDSQGENVVQDKHVITVSQLSLVDLAGSERTNRTKNTGQRLREAGNINNSLMTLRTCLEYLRENQLTGSTKKIPYRDSKITHLFKNYFDGEGQVSMVVCINPRAEDYDETAQVMKFAEMTQEVQVPRPVPVKFDLGLTPGRRKANKALKEAFNHLTEMKTVEVDLGMVYSFEPNFPEVKLDNPEAENIYTELIQFLERRIERRRTLIQDFNARNDNFRMHLMEMERENISLKTENESLNAILKQERLKIKALEKKIIIHESSIDELNRKLRDREEKCRELQRILNEKQTLLDQKVMEKEKQKKKFTTKMAVEADKFNKQMELKLREQENKLQEKMRIRDAKLKLVSNILNAEKTEELPLMRSVSSENLASHRQNVQIEPSVQQSTIYFTPRPQRDRGVPVANNRHRRSRSTGEKWLEHRAQNPVPLGTILQPYYKCRKSVTKLTDVKDLANAKTSRYCLISQEADTDGDVETKLYKGNVIPTSGGGAQVVFNDVECLTQKSPVSSPQRKRPSNGIGAEMVSEEVASRCTVGIEGHSSAKKSKV